MDTRQQSSCRGSASAMRRSRWYTDAKLLGIDQAHGGQVSMPGRWDPDDVAQHVRKHANARDTGLSACAVLQLRMEQPASPAQPGR